MKAYKRCIAIITGTRAEYGLLRPLMSLLKSDDSIDFRLIACAAHLSPEFGLTRNQIVEDGFVVDEDVEMLLSADTPSAIAKAVGLGCIGFADAFRRISPDLIVVLGDRFEILAAVQAALFARIPVAHLHGGELTEGAIDDAIRHAVTKMSHLHFVAAEAYRDRVIQMGENPSGVFNVGAIGLDAIRGLKPEPLDGLQERFGIPADKPFLMVSWHPETLSGQSARDAFRELVAALDSRDEFVVMSYPNADQGSRDVVFEMESFAARRRGVLLVKNFGQQAYLNIMSYASAIVGNSSSGIIEAPSLGIPTVNIGDRQKGRLRAASVVDCNANTTSILTALDRVSTPLFQEMAARKVNPYGDGRTATRIAQKVMTIPLDHILHKRFYDIAKRSEPA